MTEKMGYTPKTHELMEEGERIDSEFNSLPSIQEAGRLLESTLLSDKFKYYPQSKVIKECLKEVFGENERYIRFVNKFLYDIGELIDSHYELNSFKGNKNSQDYQELKAKYEMRSDDIDEYFIHYGQEFADKLREQNPKLDRREQMKLKIDLFNKFKNLLLQRIHYMPNKE